MRGAVGKRSSLSCWDEPVLPLADQPPPGPGAREDGLGCVQI